MSDVIMFGTGSLMNDDTKRLGYLERTAENEALLADEVSRRIRAHGKATPKLRRQLAVNLGKILERLKGCFTIQDLALQSGIAGEDNVKPGDRISRFRIRPGVEPSSSVLGALSADTKHYLALAKCAAELAGEPSSKLVLELVDGTTLCPTLNRDLNIEPYEHMQRLIKTLVDEICLKHDLTSYFDAIRCNNLRLEKLDDDGITWWCDSCDWRYYRPLAFPRVYLATTALAQGSGTLFFGDHPPLPAKIWHSQSVELAIAVTADDPEPQPYFLVQDRTSIQAEYNYSDRIKFFELGLALQLRCSVPI